MAYKQLFVPTLPSTRIDLDLTIVPSEAGQACAVVIERAAVACSSIQAAVRFAHVY